MNPTIFGVIGPGFLNQVPTLRCRLQGCEFGACRDYGSRSQSSCDQAKPRPSRARCPLHSSAGVTRCGWRRWRPPALTTGFVDKQFKVDLNKVSA